MAGAYGGQSLNAQEAKSSVSGATGQSYSDDHTVLGLYGGYNFVRPTGFTWGPDVILTGLSSDGTRNDAVVGATSFEGSYLFSPRVRLGYATDKAFFYGHLGLGFSNIGVEGSDSGTNITGGGTIGVGVEVATSDLWSLRVEASSYGFNVDDRTINGVERELDGEVHQFSLGLTRKF